MSEEAAKSLGVEFAKGGVAGGGLSGIAGWYWWNEAEKECVTRAAGFCIRQKVTVLGVPFYSAQALGVLCALIGLMMVGGYLAYLAYTRNQRIASG